MEACYRKVSLPRDQPRRDSALQFECRANGSYDAAPTRHSVQLPDAADGFDACAARAQEVLHAILTHLAGRPFQPLVIELK